MCFDLLTFAVPLNAGSLEGSRVLVLNFLGYAPGAGMTYAIALRLGQTFWGIVGLGVRATFGARLNTMAQPSCRAGAFKLARPTPEKRQVQHGGPAKGKRRQLVIQFLAGPGELQMQKGKYERANGRICTIDRNFSETNSLAKMGAVLERAAMGHRP